MSAQKRQDGSTESQDTPAESQDTPAESRRDDTSTSHQKTIPIMRRDVLILISVWVSGCVIVAVLLGLFYANTVTPKIPEQPTPRATFAIPFTEDSAKTTYLLALQEAQNWQSDVRIVALSTRWSNATVQDLGQAGIWDFRFFSTKSSRIFFAVVTPDKEVAGRAHINKLKHAPYLIDPVDWVIDSSEAISIWANNGGGYFLQAYPENRVELLLRQTLNGPVWDIIGISADQSQIFYLSIDATDGTVLNRQ